MNVFFSYNFVLMSFIFGNFVLMRFHAISLSHRLVFANGCYDKCLSCCYFLKMVRYFLVWCFNLNVLGMYPFYGSFRKYVAFKVRRIWQFSRLRECVHSRVKCFMSIDLLSINNDKLKQQHVIYGPTRRFVFQCGEHSTAD